MILDLLMKLRLGRRGYLNAVMVALTLRVLLILAVAIAAFVTPTRTLPSWVFYVVFIWMSVDLWPAYAWRLHDMDRPGWIAGPLIVGVGALTLLGFTGLLNRALAGSVAPAWTNVAQFGLVAGPIMSIAFTVWLGLQKGDEDENRFTRWRI
jgi:uncharacterized membrane protein YhaH (DUF805 family)